MGLLWAPLPSAVPPPPRSPGAGAAFTLSPPHRQRGARPAGRRPLTHLLPWLAPPRGDLVLLTSDCCLLSIYSKILQDKCVSFQTVLLNVMNYILIIEVKYYKVCHHFFLNVKTCKTFSRKSRLYLITPCQVDTSNKTPTSQQVFCVRAFLLILQVTFQLFTKQVVY